MTNKEFIEHILNVKTEGYEDRDGYYVVELEDSDEFQYVYLKIDSNEELYLDSSEVNADINKVTFVTTSDDSNTVDNYEVELIADFSNGSYYVSTKRIEE